MEQCLVVSEGKKKKEKKRSSVCVCVCVRMDVSGCRTLRLSFGFLSWV